MRNHDNGFARAQRSYERQLPPEDDTIECPECEGEGTIPCSDCCESEIRNGHCVECGENCSYAQCPTCKGEKYVEPQKDEPEPDRDPSDS